MNEEVVSFPVGVKADFKIYLISDDHGDEAVVSLNGCSRYPGEDSIRETIATTIGMLNQDLDGSFRLMDNEEIKDYQDRQQEEEDHY